MAIIENGFLRGQIRNLVNRKVGDQNIVQSKPQGSIKQSEWTKAAALDSGRASTAGALIRRAFINTHKKLHDGKMHNRLLLQVQRTMRAADDPDIGFMSVRKGNLNRLVNFQFNEHSHMHDYLYVDPTVDLDTEGLLTVHLPAFEKSTSITRPKFCSHVVLQFQLVTLKLSSKDFRIIAKREMEIDFTKKGRREAEQSFTVDCKDVSGDLLLVGLSLLFLSTDSHGRSYVHNHLELNPASIIAVFRLTM